jgi:hypothetical protein
VVYKNGLYDLSDFTHPGGNILIKYIVGQEISRYLLGI